MHFSPGWIKTLCKWAFPSNFFFLPLHNSPSGPGPHYREFTITHRHTTLDRTPLDEWSAPDEENCTWQHTTLTGDRNPCPTGIRTRNPSKRVAADPRLRPRGHRDRLSFKLSNKNSGYHCQYKKKCVNILWEGTQRVLVANFSRLDDMVVILVYLAAQDFSTCISRCWRW